MSGLRFIKWAVIAGWLIVPILLAAPASLSKSEAPGAYWTGDDTAAQGDYVGSDACSACHELQFNSFSKTVHSRLTKAKWKSEHQGCESCHGPGKAHIDGGGDKTKIRTFENETSKQISDTCLRCHAGKEEHNNFRRGEHWRNDVGCTDCHSPHASSRQLPGPTTDGSSSLQPVGPFPSHASNFIPVHMLKRPEVVLCMACHNETKAQFNLPFHHKVLEGVLNCSDCHNPHGGFELKQARLATGADAACYKCHADKQGPFVFEHAPLKIEGCTACHDPHGSANPKLLKRNQVSQLCLECHSNIGTKTGEPSVAPGTPDFHNLTTARYQNCTTCHSKIHGSNASRVFFR